MSVHLIARACMVLILLIGPTADAQTRLVPQTYPTVQAALDAATPGDTVLVGPGVYAENLWVTKAVRLVATGAFGSVVLEDPASGAAGPRAGIVVTVDAPGASGEITGFVVRGRLDVNGAGILLSSPGWSVRGCRVVSNWTGIRADAPARIEGNTIGETVGFGILSFGGSQILRNDVLTEERGAYVSDGDVVAGNLFVNQFTGVSVQASTSDPAVLSNNVFTTVGATNAGEQMSAVWLGPGNAVLSNNVIAFVGRDGFYSFGATGEFALRYNDVYLNRPNYEAAIGDRTGIDGNVSVAPGFARTVLVSPGAPVVVDPLAFVLRSDSPLIDAGNPAETDSDGSRSDIGMYGGPLGRPLRYAPASFALEAPADSAEVPGPVRLSWSASFDRDPGDAVSYRVLLGRLQERCAAHASTFVRCLDGPVDTLRVGGALSVDFVPSDTADYTWTVEALDRSGLVTPAGEVRAFRLAPVASEGSPPALAGLVLERPAPNPTRGQTTLSFSLLRGAFVTLDVYDVAGRRIESIFRGEVSSGTHRSVWSAEGVAPGVYLVRAVAGGDVQTRPLVVR